VGCRRKASWCKEGKSCIYVKWRAKRNPIGSKCLNQCTNENPTRLKVEKSPTEVALASGWQRRLVERKRG